MDDVDGVGGELGPRAADMTEPVLDVAADGRAIQRADMIGRRHALRELAKLGTHDHVSKLGLANEDQLQKLVLVGIDVGQHPKLFQPFDGKVLRLVDQQDDAPTVGVFLLHVFLQALEHRYVGPAQICLDRERVQHPLQKLAPPSLRVRDQAQSHVVVQRLEQFLDQRGLARADLAGDDGDGRARDDAEFENREGTPMRPGPEQEVRIGQERERPFGKAEILNVKIVTRHGFAVSANREALCPLSGSYETVKARTCPM